MAFTKLAPSFIDTGKLYCSARRTESDSFRTMYIRPVMARQRESGRSAYFVIVHVFYCCGAWPCAAKMRVDIVLWFGIRLIRQDVERRSDNRSRHLISQWRSDYAVFQARNTIPLLNVGSLYAIRLFVCQ